MTRSLTPLPAVILGIDPGKTSGFAILGPQSRQAASFGIVTPASMDCGEVLAASAPEVRRVITSAQELSTAYNLPLVVVAEKWTAGGWASHTTLLGLGAAWGAWEAALREAGHPKRRIVRVYLQTWRAAIIGGRQRPTEAWKLAAQAQVRHRFGVNAGPDAAEAACVALWGSHAAEVAAVLPKRRAKAG